MFVRELKKLGLNSGEASIYSFLLENGDAAPAEIARTTGLGRTNIYEYAKCLEGMGLLSEYEKKKKIIYHAESPRELGQELQKKLTEVRELNVFYQQLLPQMEELYRKNYDMPTIRYYFGDEGYRTISNMVYLEGSEHEVFHLVKSLDNYEPPEPRYRNTIQTRQLFTLLFANSGANLQEFQRRDEREQRKTVLIKAPISQDLMVYEESVIIGSFNRKNFNVAVIKSFAFAEFIKSLCRQALLNAEMLQRVKKKFEPAL